MRPPAAIVCADRAQAASTSPSRNGSCPGLGGEEGPRRLGVAVAPPDEDACRRFADAERLASSRTSLRGHGRIVQVPSCIAFHRRGAHRTDPLLKRAEARGYPQDGVSESNYTSGDDYVVEFLGYRFSFNAIDFEQRVNAAAVASAGRAGRARGGRDRRPRRADRPRAHRRSAERPGRVPRPPLGAGRPRQRRVARLLAAQAHLPRRLARPARQGEPARGRLGRRRRPSSATASRTEAAPCSSWRRALLARAPVRR